MLVNTIRGTLKLIGAVSPAAAGALAFHLFCRPTHRARIRPGEAGLMQVARTSRLTVNGKQVCVYRWGDGERPVLMLHGWTSRASRFAELARQLLERGFSPIAFDAPAHGDSSGKTTTILEYQAICERLAEECGRFSAIVGHSFGALCQFRALRVPIAADKVVAVSGVSDFGYLEEAYSEQLQLNQRTRAELRRRIERLFLPLEGIWDRLSATYDADKLGIPVLAIHDEGDKVVDVAQAQRLVQAYQPRARLWTTRRLGHHRILADGTVVRQIVDFIESDGESDRRTSPRGDVLHLVSAT